MEKKKLLFVCTRQFWPTTTGKQITLYYDCKGLHESCGYDIYLFCFADKNTNKALSKPEFIEDVQYIDIPGKRSAAGNVLKHSLFGTMKWPLQNDLYYSKDIEEKLLQYYAKVKPEVVIIDMVRLVPYILALKDEPIRKILIAEDDLAKRYRRQIESSGEGNAAGYFAKNMSRLGNLISSMKFVKNSVLRTEIAKLEKYEACFTELFDNITFISPIETREFNKRHHTDKAVTLTMGADIDFFSEEVDYQRQDMSLVYVGNYTYAPNADSIRWICKEIIPKLDRHVVLNVVGKCPDELRKEIESEQVKVLGFVDDIRVTVKSAAVYLSPIAYGTGIKTKIVEAMAMGQAIVTNSVGAESLDVESGKQLFIEDTVEGIVKRVNELLKDAEQRDVLGKNAKEYVLAHHSWEKVYAVYKEIGL